MKLSTSTTIISVLLLHLSNGAMAQGFLKQLDARKEDAVTAYNSRVIDEHLYFAKRHRIVEVDALMLREPTIDGVTLFESDEKIGLRRERMHVGQILGAATWIGNVALPPESLDRDQWSKAELEEVETDGLTLEQLISLIGRVELQILYWDIDLTTGEAYPSAERRNKQLGPTPVAGAVAGDVEEYAFATVRGDINLSFLGRGIYRLEPLRNSPRYHILYEVDPTKTFGVVETDRSAKTPIGKEGQKKLNYDEFLKSLPPRTAILTKGEIE